LSSIVTGTVESSFQTDSVSEIHLDDGGKVGDVMVIVALRHHTHTHHCCGVVGTYSKADSEYYLIMDAMD
jgi:hypothetical protein